MAKVPNYNAEFSDTLARITGRPRVLHYTKAEWQNFLRKDSIGLSLDDLMVTLVYTVKGEGFVLELLDERYIDGFEPTIFRFSLEGVYNTEDYVSMGGGDKDGEDTKKNFYPIRIVREGEVVTVRLLFMPKGSC